MKHRKRKAEQEEREMMEESEKQPQSEEDVDEQDVPEENEEEQAPEEDEEEWEKPLLSVVIPVYNAQEFLPICLLSIRKQTYQNWEVILVDDGSKDDSPRICDEAAAEDPRFRVIHKENAGVSRARNDGIDAAKGKYLMFIDADDVVLPYCFHDMVRAGEKYGTDLVVCGFDRFNGWWKKRYQLTHFHVAIFRDLQQFLMLYTVPRTNMFGVSIWAKLYRMEMINEFGVRFDPDITYEEDCVFVTECLKHVKTIAAMGAAMYRYRQQEESLSKGYRKDTFKFLVNGYNRRCEIMRDNGLEQFLPKLRAIFFTVIKNTCKKILESDLSKEEKIAEYGKLMEFPEVQETAAAYHKRSKSGLTNRICGAIKKKDPQKLDRVMRSWVVKDKIVAFKNKVMRFFKRMKNKTVGFVKRNLWKIKQRIKRVVKK